MFGIVEGNSTFYGLPGLDQFQRWADEAIDGFEFCFKFPQQISHQLMLRNCQSQLDQFLMRLNVLAQSNRLGPTFLQLGPSFSYQHFNALESFLHGLPKSWPWAVEVRHLDWFDESTKESELNQLLSELGIDRVLFDSRPLYATPPSDDAERLSQSRKPRSPYRTTITGSRPMLRLIGRNRAQEVDLFWRQWSKTISHWISAGLKPYIFTHAPDDRFAPELAFKLHALIRQELLELQPNHPPLSELVPLADQNPVAVQQMLF